MQNLNLFVVSNMYPSEKDKYFGVFVKNFIDYFNSKKGGTKVSTKAVIKGRGKNIFSKTLKYLLFSVEVIYKFFCKKYDVVYVHYVNNTLLPFLILIPFLNKKKIILNFHGGDLNFRSQISKVLSVIIRPVIKKANLIITPSSSFKILVKEKLNIPAELIEVSHSGGINLNLFNIKNPSINSLNKSKLLYVGRLEKSKGIDILLQAFESLVKKNNKELTLTIVGKGTKLPELEKKIKKESLSDVINIIPGVDQSQLPEIYWNHSVLIFPSYSESLGLVGLEAMACGLPVIGSNIDGINEYLLDKENGYTFNVGDSTDLENKINIFTKLDNHALSKMRSSCVQKSRLFSTETVMNHLNQLILQV